MAIYRFYRLSSGKRLAAPAADHEFDGDLLALEHAKGLANGHAVGVWEGARFVANVEPDDSSMRGEPRFSARRAS